jgi:hypothetical protein
VDRAATLLVQRLSAIGAICLVVAAIAPAAPQAGNEHRGWAATAIPQATLEIPGKGPRISALSSDGRMAVVADPQGVYVSRASSDGSWAAISKPAARLRMPRWALPNLTAVATSSRGTTLLVAAGAVGNHRAAVFVFHVSSPRAWKSRARPTAKLTNPADPGGFGSGVALSSDGRTALVGEPGGADVFHVATADSWRDSSKPTARLVADPEGAAAGGLGIAVALSADGTTALVGTTNLDSFVGAVYVFRAAAADAWTSRAIPDAVLTDGVAGLFGDGFGGAVALSPDGLTALVGAPNLAFGPAGAAYLFEVRSPDNSTSTTNPVAVVDYGSGGAGAVPGWSVALSEDGTALIGEPSVWGRAGAADVTRPDRSWSVGPTSHARLTDAASQPGDFFGASVALSSDGTTALVSSVRATFIYTRVGSKGATHCYVPYLHGKTIPAARRAIRSTHCRLGKVTRVRTAQGWSDLVISQTPGPGARPPAGTTIELKAGKSRS